MNRPTQWPDKVVDGQPYWKVIMPDGRHGIYSVGGLGDYYFSVLDVTGWDDEPQELYDWYVSALPAGLIQYFN